MKKDELADKLNELLGIDVDWKKMTLKDLEEIYNALHGEKILRLATRIAKKKISKAIETVETLASELEEEGGIFGFGIIPRIKKKVMEGGEKEE